MGQIPVSRSTVTVCLLLFIFPCIIRSQDSFFVQRRNTELILSGKRFYAIGANAYYLQELTARGDTSRVISVLQSARQLGLTAIRTWGFHDGDNAADPAIIQVGPGQYNETALRALDYVVARARDLSLRLILPLVNNWDAYGGMNQYVRWLAQASGARRMLGEEKNAPGERVISTGGRSYALRVSTTLGHDDFYRNDTIKQWYKDYVRMLLNRVNVYTGRAYREEPTILMWEMANEPRSSDRSGALVFSWMAEMSSYIKSIDERHLIGSGEEGHDVTTNGYDLYSVGVPRWMYDGTVGSSFLANVRLPDVDVAGVHCYPDDWGVAPAAIIPWIQGHLRLAADYNKPFLVTEIGIRRNRTAFFDAILSGAWREDVSGVLLWQLSSKSSVYDDGFAFSCPEDYSLCRLLTQYAQRFRQKSDSVISVPPAVKMLPNYPNPFNSFSALTFDLPTQEFIRLELFTLLGHRLQPLLEEIRHPGRHVFLLDGTSLPSGVYIVRLTAGESRVQQKIVILK